MMQRLGFTSMVLIFGISIIFNTIGSCVNLFAIDRFGRLQIDYCHAIRRNGATISFRYKIVPLVTLYSQHNGHNAHKITTTIISMNFDLCILILSLSLSLS